MTYDLPYSRSCESESEPLGIRLQKHQWFLEPCQWPSDFSRNLLSPKYHPPKKNKWIHHSNCIKAVWLFLFHQFLEAFFLGLETQGARCWICLWNALEVLVCQVKARGVVGEALRVKNINGLVAMRQKNRGFGLVSLYHFNLAYVMLMSYMSKFHTRRGFREIPIFPMDSKINTEAWPGFWSVLLKHGHLFFLTPKKPQKKLPWLESTQKPRNLSQIPCLWIVKWGCFF